MWKLHRYYLKEVAISVSLTFLVLFGIALIAFVYRGIDRSQGGDLLAALLITFYFAADTFPHLMAMALLFGAVLTFSRASQDREITAIRAAGISPRVPMVAVLIVGLGFSIAGVYAQHWLIPSAHFNKYRVVADVARQLFLSTGAAGDKISFGDFVMFWRERGDDDRFHDVIVKLGESERTQTSASVGGNERVLQAREAWLEREAGTEELTLRFRDLRDVTGQSFENLWVKVNIREITERGRRTESDKDMSSAQLLGEVYRGVHDNPGGALFSVHLRTCFAVMPALFAPIGFCIGVLARDRGRMLALILCMVPLVLFYGSVMVAPQLVRVLDLPGLGWLPAIVIGGLGGPFCWKLLRT